MQENTVRLRGSCTRRRCGRAASTAMPEKGAAAPARGGDAPLARRGRGRVGRSAKSARNSSSGSGATTRRRCVGAGGDPTLPPRGARGSLASPILDRWVGLDACATRMRKTGRSQPGLCRRHPRTLGHARTGSSSALSRPESWATRASWAQPLARRKPRIAVLDSDPAETETTLAVIVFDVNTKAAMTHKQASNPSIPSPPTLRRQCAPPPPRERSGPTPST